MPSLVTALGLSGNPFEHYTAETEPNIAEYAVKPPYLEAIAARAITPSSFILFGDRGAGKSATRITLFNELWRAKGNEAQGAAKAPLALNYIDFSRAISAFRKKEFSERDLIEEVAFLVVEQILAWLASLTDEDRATYTGALMPEENELIVALLKTFYLSRPEMERKRTESAALKLLNQAWTTKSALWIGKRWDALSKLFGGIVDGLAKAYVSSSTNVAAPIEELLRSFRNDGAAGSRFIIEKLVDFVRIFSFSGVVVLIDKVDETEVAQNSADATTQLVFPLLSHIQLLEIEGFAWMLFLWSQVKPYLESDRYKVRLDKIAHTSIDWEMKFFRQMLDARIQYFSNGRLMFVDLFDPQVNISNVVADLVSTSMKSPRELIRLLDTIVTEHDIQHGERPETFLLNEDSLAIGQDKYVQDRINSIYNEKTLAQIFRLESVRFTNRDVQTTFRVNPQSARNRIKGWEDAGIVKQTGTRAAEGDLGGKPSYEYSVVDTRVERIIRRRLVRVEDMREDDDAEHAEKDKAE